MTSDKMPKPVKYSDGSYSREYEEHTQQPVDGETSDGYHTFNELYEHRHALFAAVCAAYGGWKSKLHDDGTFLEGWFIAGFETPEGQATYHLPLRLYDDFPAEELLTAPAWDGHTSDMVIDRVRLAALTKREV